jgi:hypothetical protein
MRGDRKVLYDKEKISISKVVERCSCPHARTIEIEKDGVRQKKMLTLGSAEIHIPEHQKPLTLVAIKGYAEGTEDTSDES